MQYWDPLNLVKLKLTMLEPTIGSSEISHRFLGGDDGYNLEPSGFVASQIHSLFLRTIRRRLCDRRQAPTGKASFFGWWSSYQISCTYFRVMLSLKGCQRPPLVKQNMNSIVNGHLRWVCSINYDICYGALKQI